MAITRNNTFYTKDGVQLGRATDLYSRPPAEVDPLVKLYAQYVRVFTFDMGADWYIPTDFIAEQDEESGDVTLSLTMKQVEKKTFGRMPQFVAYERGEHIDLV